MIITPKIVMLKKQLAWRYDELDKALNEQRFAEAKEHEIEAGRIRGFLHVYSVLLEEFPYIDRADELLEFARNTRDEFCDSWEGYDDSPEIPTCGCCSACKAKILMDKIEGKE